jgi:mannose-6-phosphate isomerase-like protein (cupin superfamily)
MSTAQIKNAADPLWFLHNLAVIHARGDGTGGSYGVVELTGAPGDTPPLHVHHHDDEGFYVLDGALRLHIGRGTIDLGPGQFARAPSGTPHVYFVVSETPARWLTISNGGFERFVEEVSIPARTDTIPDDPHVPSANELREIALRHGIELLGPLGTLP